MATGLLAQYQASTPDQSDFHNRILIALVGTGQAISTELGTVINHVNRVALMKLIANSPASYVQPFAYLLASQGVDTNSTDTAISNMVSAVWNTISGVP